MRAARLVVDEDARRHGEDAHPAREGRRALQLDMRLKIAGQHILEGEGELRQLVRTVERRAVTVLYPESVEGHAVGHRHDLGVDDVGARYCECPGDAREEARV